LVPDVAGEHSPILLTGLLPDGQAVLVTLWDPDGAIRAATPGGVEAEIAQRFQDHDRWSTPASLYEAPGSAS
jgi:hypothetical protein